jgi:monoamine oxidase
MEDPELEHAMEDAMARAASVAKETSDRSFADALRDAAVSEPGRSLALTYVRGFEAADPDRISAHAMAKGDIGADRTRRFAHGYDALVNALARRVDSSRVHLRFVATAVRWERGQVNVVGSKGDGTTSLREFESERAILALPLGVLNAGSLSFVPPLDAKQSAIGALGRGHVVRVVLRFREPFWQASPMGRPGSFVQVPGAPFPSLWSAAPVGSHLLIAWAGGPDAEALLGLDKRALDELALQTIERAISKTRSELERTLVESAVHPWSNDPFSRAAYSYPLVGGMEAGDALAEPMADTLFFAGEAACAPPANGTVEGAIASGRRAASAVIRSIASA